MGQPQPVRSNRYPAGGRNYKGCKRVKGSRCKRRRVQANCNRCGVIEGMGSCMGNWSRHPVSQAVMETVRWAMRGPVSRVRAYLAVVRGTNVCVIRTEPTAAEVHGRYNQSIRVRQPGRQGGKCGLCTGIVRGIHRMFSISAAQPVVR